MRGPLLRFLDLGQSLARMPLDVDQGTCVLVVAACAAMPVVNVTIARQFDQVAAAQTVGDPKA